MTLQIFTLKLLVLLNFASFWLILTLTHLLAKGSNQVEVLGWICLVLSVSVFAAPLSIMVRIPNHVICYTLLEKALE